MCQCCLNQELVCNTCAFSRDIAVVLASYQVAAVVHNACNTVLLARNAALCNKKHTKQNTPQRYSSIQGPDCTILIPAQHDTHDSAEPAPHAEAVHCQVNCCFGHNSCSSYHHS